MMWGGVSVELTVSEAAIQELRELHIPEGQGLRIDAELTGGWSSTIDIQLALDESRKNDTVIEIEHLKVYIDRFTQRYLDENLTLDFDATQGFKLFSPNEIISQGLTLFDRETKGSSC